MDTPSPSYTAALPTYDEALLDGRSKGKEKESTMQGDGWVYEPSGRQEPSMDVEPDASNPLLPQLISQASALGSCSALIRHLHTQLQTERAHWEAERDGWDRSAEALIRGRVRAGSVSGLGMSAVGGRHSDGHGERPVAIERLIEDLTHRNGLLTSEVRGRGDALNDALARISALEYELAMLKPLLLFSSPTHSLPHLTASLTHYTSPAPRAHRHYPSSQYVPPPQPYESSPKHKQPETLSADARIEHILLAARKIGRERAVLISHTKGKESRRHYRESTSSKKKSTRGKGGLDRLASAAAALEANAPQSKRRRVSSKSQVGESALDVLAAAAAGARGPGPGPRTIRSDANKRREDLTPIEPDRIFPLPPPPPVYASRGEGFGVIDTRGGYPYRERF